MARKCPVCGSRKWRKNPDGFLVCEDGHVLAGFRSESNVADGPSQHALQKRRLLKGGPRINKRKEIGRADKSLYHGRDAEWLRLQGLQLLLRYQIQALQKLWSIPDALETIARDLWTYQLLISKVPPRPSASQPPSPRRRPTIPLRKNSRKSLADDVTTPSEGSETERGGGDDSEDDSDSGSVVSDDPAADLDPELAALLPENSDGSDDDEQAERDGQEASPKEPWKRSRPIRVSDVLVTTALALWILRVPFTYAKLEQVINANEIPYIDFARTTLLPPDMVKHMNREVRSSLRPQRCPSPSYLFDLTRKFARTITAYFNVKLPEVNLPPVAWHVISQLGGTPTTYSQVISFLELVDANMSITDVTYEPYLRKRRNSDTQLVVMAATRQRDVHMPELSIAAAWVVVMKLAYGLDGQPRPPLISSDPVIGMPKCDMWIAELARRLKNGAFKGTLRDLQSLPFHTMPGADIDGFLNRAEQVLLKDRDHGSAGGNLFPLPRLPPPSSTPDPNSWTAFHERASHDPTTQAKAPDAKTPNTALPLLPGEAVRMYDPSSALPRDLAVVVDAAAAVVGVTPEDVRRVVELFERRMEAARPRRGYPETLAAPRLRRTGSGHGLRESRSFSSFGQ